MKKNVVTFVSITFLVLAVILLPGCKESEVTPTNTGFVGKMWVLQSIFYNGIGESFPSGTFSIRFNNDGSFDMNADCNSCGGTYSLGNEGIITFPSGFVCTEVDCGPGSGDTEFLAAMNRVVGYQYDSESGKFLALFFIDNGNWLYFERGN